MRGILILGVAGWLAVSAGAVPVLTKPDLEKNEDAELAFPLANAFGLMKPGDYHVEADWTWLRAPTNREPYTIEKVGNEMKFLLARSRQEGR